MTLPFPALCRHNGDPTTANTVTSTTTTATTASSVTATSSLVVNRRRTAACLSLAWPPDYHPLVGGVSAAAGGGLLSKRERRRAICSWSVGAAAVGANTTGISYYGTLGELYEGKVADGGATLTGGLLEATAGSSSGDLTSSGGGGDGNTAPSTASRRARALFAMPGLKSLVSRRRNSGGGVGGLSDTTSTTTPLVRRPPATITTTTNTTQLHNHHHNNNTTTTPSLANPGGGSGGGGSTSNLILRPPHTTTTTTLLYNSIGTRLGSLINLRKCDSSSSKLKTSVSSANITGDGSLVVFGQQQPLQAVNRLRVSPHGSVAARMCSRCSSLLTLATGSRYSLDTSTGGFVPVAAAVVVSESEDGGVHVTPLPPPILCKLCLVEVPAKDACRIEQCSCCFCVECMCSYVKYEIAEGAYDISCPDAECPCQGALGQEEIKRLAGVDLLQKHLKYRLNREVEVDQARMWCPRAGCETVCTLCCPSQRCEPQSVHCPTCTVDFCSNCKLEWHTGLSCDANNKRLAKEGRAEEAGIPFDSDLIKCCPMCKVPIEKDEGCAQMMCKRCKHVFCWYCLASLDDDFLLRHYDKGPCKNKLGHSRASVIWHRTQVIGIFAGFGILLLVASPLLLLAAPCIVCCKCRVCNADNTGDTLGGGGQRDDVSEEVGHMLGAVTSESGGGGELEGIRVVEEESGGGGGGGKTRVMGL